MSADVGFCSVGDNLSKAVEIMWRRDCGAVPVVDGELKVVGIITDRDIAVAVNSQNKKTAQIKIGDVAGKRVYTCLETDDAENILKKMRRAKIRRLPVVDEKGSLMGEVMTKNSFSPEIIVSSPAERAKQTANLVKDSAALQAEVLFDERIYEASPLRLLDVVSGIEDEYDSALLVGHNPGFENLIRVLTGKIEAMPTAALAIVDLEIGSWKEINAETGSLRNLIRPKEI